MRFFSTKRRRRRHSRSKGRTPGARGILVLLLVGLAILSAVSHHFWWPSTIRAWLLRGCWAALCLNILLDVRRGKLGRPAGTKQLAAAIASLAVVTGFCLTNRFGWAVPVTTAYLLWRFMPWRGGSSNGSAGSSSSGGIDPSKERDKWEIPICFPFTRISIPDWLYSIRIEKEGNRYSLVVSFLAVLGEAPEPSDLCYCAHPDVTWVWTQHVPLRTSRLVVQRRDDSALHCWVSTEDVLTVIAHFSNAITAACDANGLKRFVPDRG